MLKRQKLFFILLTTVFATHSLKSASECENSECDSNSLSKHKNYDTSKGSLGTKLLMIAAASLGIAVVCTSLLNNTSHTVKNSASSRQSTQHPQLSQQSYKRKDGSKLTIMKDNSDQMWIVQDDNTMTKIQNLQNQQRTTCGLYTSGGEIVEVYNNDGDGIRLDLWQ